MNAKLFPLLLSAALGAGTMLVLAQDSSQTPKHASNHGTKASAAPRAGNNHAGNGEDEGERVFAEHCSRCHNAPQSISPRITGTVVRHMRVRANLTGEEERAVLHFFNP